MRHLCYLAYALLLVVTNTRAEATVTCGFYASPRPNSSRYEWQSLSKHAALLPNATACSLVDWYVHDEAEGGALGAESDVVTTLHVVLSLQPASGSCAGATRARALLALCTMTVHRHILTVHNTALVHLGDARNATSPPPPQPMNATRVEAVAVLFESTRLHAYYGEHSQNMFHYHERLYTWTGSTLQPTIHTIVLRAHVAPAASGETVADVTAASYGRKSERALVLTLLSANHRLRLVRLCLTRRAVPSSLSSVAPSETCVAHAGQEGSTLGNATDDTRYTTARLLHVPWPLPVSDASEGLHIESTCYNAEWGIGAVILTDRQRGRGYFQLYAVEVRRGAARLLLEVDAATDSEADAKLISSCGLAQRVTFRRCSLQPTANEAVRATPQPVPFSDPSTATRDGETLQVWLTSDVQGAVVSQEMAESALPQWQPCGRRLYGTNVTLAASPHETHATRWRVAPLRRVDAWPHTHTRTRPAVGRDGQHGRCGRLYVAPPARWRLQQMKEGHVLPRVVTVDADELRADTALSVRWSQNSLRCRRLSSAWWCRADDAASDWSRVSCAIVRLTLPELCVGFVLLFVVVLVMLLLRRH